MASTQPWNNFQRILEGRLQALRALRAPTPRTDAELQLVEQALGRLASGAYGTCSRCGGAIGWHRLRALPETELCARCAADS